MGITLSLLLTAAGAILLWAVNVTASGIDIHAVGAILLVVGIIGSLVMLYVYYASVWPIQPMPGPLWPIIFVSWMIIGFAWYFIVRSRSPHVMAQIGAIHETNEAMVGARR